MSTRPDTAHEDPRSAHSDKAFANANAQFRLLYVSVLAAGVGLVGGLAAYGLYSLIALFSNLVFFQTVAYTLPALEHNTLGPWILLAPALGGIVVGIMAKYGSSKIRGHGIPEAMEAVLLNRSRISPRVAILKPLSAAIAIGTGGPFGAEGPIIQTGSAIGSIFGQMVPMTGAERKVLLACGAASGMAATFGTPIAAVIFAIELLLFEFKSRSFIPLTISTTLATSVHFRLLGSGPMFHVGSTTFHTVSQIHWYVLLGLICGLAASLLSKALYWIEDQFERLPLDEMWRPAIGGAALGIIGLFAPRVLGVGYDIIGDLLNGRLALATLLLVLVCKSLALLISLGSGTSGGLLAPTFMIGGALGSVFSIGVDHLVPGAHLMPAAYALVAMAAVFAAASRSTFAFIVFAFEITRSYESVLPLMLVCVIATGISLLLSRNSIMTEKLARRGFHVRQETDVDVLHHVCVGEVMDREPAAIPPAMSLGELADGMARHDRGLTRHQALPIVDPESGRLLGVVTHGDVFRALQRGVAADTPALDIGSRRPVSVNPQSTLHDAVEIMLRHGVGRLLVVDARDPTRLIGYLGRAPILEARIHRMHEEQVREAGWLQKLLTSTCD